MTTGYRKLTLCFGLYPVNILRGYQDNEAVFKAACDKAKEIIPPLVPGKEGQEGKGKPLIENGNLVVITAGYPLDQPGTTNLVKLHRVGG